MLDGIYLVTFRGRADWGSGLLIFQHGVLTGADAGGVLYDGSFKERGPDVDLKLTMTVPPGVTLVQGTRAQSKQYSISSEITLPISEVLQEKPILLELPPGPVNVIFRRLRMLGV